MELQPKRPSARGPAAWFTGEVWIDSLAASPGPSSWGMSSVHFTPGARTAWHRHADGQTFYVAEGEGRTQARGGEVIAIRAGHVVQTPGNEWHWHGAAPDHFMSHFSITEGHTEWGEHVTDAEYEAPAS
jgi:quercetin dioxygenase-like cupin family protein